MKLKAAISFLLGLCGLSNIVGCADDDGRPNNGIVIDDAFASQFESEVNQRFSDASVISIVDELANLLNKLEDGAETAEVASALDAFFSDSDKQLEFAVQIQRHPDILRRLFTQIAKVPDASISASSLLIRIASRCLFSEATAFLDSCQKAQDPELRIRAGLAKSVLMFRQGEVAWSIQNNPIPLDSAMVSDFEWSLSEEVKETLSHLDFRSHRREADLLANTLIQDSGSEDYSTFESVAEYGNKKRAFFSSVGGEAPLSELIDACTMLESVAMTSSPAKLTVVVIQFDHGDPESEEASFMKTLCDLSESGAVRVVLVSSRTGDELQHSFPGGDIPSSIQYIHDDDGDTWRAIGSDLICLTCVYDFEGKLRFRGHAYSSAASIRQAVAVLNVAK